MQRSKIQQVFDLGWQDYLETFSPSPVQFRTACSILGCKSPSMGCSISSCQDCGHVSIHYNSCRNRNCPNCQAVLKEVWIDARKAEVIDAPYFHVVFTLPAELNPLIYANQELLYSLMHTCSAHTLLECSQNPRFLGATPGIIQVLHTWGQELNFHPHIHCIVSGAGLTKDLKLKKCGRHFFLPAKALARKFRGKFLAALSDAFEKGLLVFSHSCGQLRNSFRFRELLDKLYNIQWCPDIRETFNGFGNALEYLGRYTHRIAITNTRIQSVSKEAVTFTARDYRNNSALKTVCVTPQEFIRRLMMHVLPAGFQKIRYYGFLNNRYKQQNLQIIFNIQGHQQFHAMLMGLSMAEILKQVWGCDTSICPVCGHSSMRPAGRTFSMRN